MQRVFKKVLVSALMFSSLVSLIGCSPFQVSRSKSDYRIETYDIKEVEKDQESGDSKSKNSTDSNENKDDNSSSKDSED